MTNIKTMKLLTALWLILFGSSAWATTVPLTDYGGPTDVITPASVSFICAGTNTSGAVTCTGAIIPAGNTIIIQVGSGNADSPSSAPTDGTANTYSLFVNSTANVGYSIYYDLNPVSVPAGHTFSAPFTTGNSTLIVVWYIHQRMSAIGTSGIAQGTSANPSCTTTGAARTGSVMFGGITLNHSGDTITPQAGWSQAYNGMPLAREAASASSISAAAGGTVTYAPTGWSNATWSCAVVEFSQ